jgi:hypothetical protein
MSAARVIGIRASAGRTPSNRFRVPFREVHLMRLRPLALCSALALAAAWLLLPASAVAADPPAKPAVNQPAPGVHTMEIYNGSMRTVRYYPSSTSPSELAALRELESAENDAALGERLQALKRQYVADESALQARRRGVQELLYGYSTTTAAIQGYGPGFGFGAYPYGNYFGYAGSSPYFGGAGGVGGSSSTASLAYGMGDEGVIKREIAPVLAAQAAPEAITRANQNLERALADGRLHSSVRVLPVERETGDLVVLKDGTRIQGKIVKEDADWVTIQTGLKNPREEKVRMSEVMRISKESSGVKPAGNP